MHPVTDPAVSVVGMVLRTKCFTWLQCILLTKQPAKQHFPRGPHHNAVLPRRVASLSIFSLTWEICSSQGFCGAASTWQSLWSPGNHASLSRPEHGTVTCAAVPYLFHHKHQFSSPAQRYQLPQMQLLFPLSFLFSHVLQRLFISHMYPK